MDYAVYQSSGHENERWNQEAQMREECGCSHEEIEYLQPKLDYMRKRLTLDV